MTEQGPPITHPKTVDLLVADFDKSQREWNFYSATIQAFRAKARPFHSGSRQKIRNLITWLQQQKLEEKAQFWESIYNELYH